MGYAVRILMKSCVTLKKVFVLIIVIKSVCCTMPYEDRSVYNILKLNFSESFTRSLNISLTYICVGPWINNNVIVKKFIKYCEVVVCIEKYNRTINRLLLISSGFCILK